MSDKNDPLSAFNFASKAQEDFFREPAPEPSAADPDVSDSNNGDILLQPRPGTNVPPLRISREDAATLGLPLDQSSELSAEDEKQIALATALAEEANGEQSPMLRKGTLTNPIVGLTDERALIEFINKTRRVTVEKIEERIVNDSTPLMLWKLREYALMGKYTETRAIEIWLNWAAKIASRPKKAETDPRVLKNGALFDATLTAGQVLEAQAQEVAKKPRSKNFSTAGDFIGKFKAPKARKSATPKARKETK